MKVEIINKPMLCWDLYEDRAIKMFVLARIYDAPTNCPYKVTNLDGTGVYMYRYAKPIPEEVEMTVAEISKALGKRVKVVE